VVLTDAQWEFIAPLLPRYRRRKDGKGRPRKDLREVLHGVLWILRKRPSYRIVDAAAGRGHVRSGRIRACRDGDGEGSIAVPIGGPAGARRRQPGCSALSKRAVSAGGRSASAKADSRAAAALGAEARASEDRFLFRRAGAAPRGAGG
jgi:hypothetical protein